VHVIRLTEDNKEENIWWMSPKGGGEPCTCCVAMIFAIY
jgi:hypothetical protein